MILNVSGISKAFDGTEVLNDISFHIEEHEKAALVGINGAGKSTLLKAIINPSFADEGQVVCAKNTEIGYLAQHQELSHKCSIYEELLSVRSDLLELDEALRASEKRMAELSGPQLEEEMRSYASMSERFERSGGYSLVSEVKGVLKGLGFSEEDFGKETGTLSGGQKTRVALGRLLLTSPDLILLDEPTNHLDMPAIEWLENYLLNYKGAVLIVSHDRYFLNRIVTKIIEIENGRSRVYSGNYDAYSEKKEQIRKAEYAAYVKALDERKHQEAVIAKLKSFNREKSIRRAESREKMLSRMETPEKPVEISSEMHLRFVPSVTSGKIVLTAEHLSAGYDGLTLFSDQDLLITRGEHVLLIGANGTGKSTLLKILNGQVEPLDGSFDYGTNVFSAYYDQEIQLLHDDKTIFEELSDAYPSMNNTEIRSALAAFLFTGDEVFKQIAALSGGERARVSLCLLMLSNANFIMLDEPTNHLDIRSREVLESAIRAYEGTVLIVSHDRYFVNKTASRILDLTNGKLISYIGNYDYYLEKKADAERAAGIEESVETDTSLPTQSKLDWQKQKEEEARIRKLKNDLTRTEKQIEELESENAAIDARFEDPAIASDPEELTKMSCRKDEILGQLEELYEKWELLQTEE